MPMLSLVQIHRDRADANRRTIIETTRYCRASELSCPAGA
ncbi:hypothetical protein D3OALGA1CA_1916 [Olavius algarvensis associated proteobacterium Delta 3]|nr:hypothetical protein D3OALGA1CA_1916 [Olavius algarvensis associated proteobacterium Delta 3]CAB5118299.1 hypothetical protein D3OALGB2SA_2809 [Olavius algarvensis associated proteobacterium Delta 3]